MDNLNRLLKSGERLDEPTEIIIKSYTKYGKFCFGMDMGTTYGFAKVLSEETVIDLGTGTGIIPILLEAKTKVFTLPV